MILLGLVNLIIFESCFFTGCAWVLTVGSLTDRAAGAVTGGWDGALVMTLGSLLVLLNVTLLAQGTHRSQLLNHPMQAISGAPTGSGSDSLRTSYLRHASLSLTSSRPITDVSLRDLLYSGYRAATWRYVARFLDYKSYAILVGACPYMLSSQGTYSYWAELRALPGCDLQSRVIRPALVGRELRTVERIWMLNSWFQLAHDLVTYERYVALLAKSDLVPKSVHTAVRDSFGSMPSIRGSLVYLMGDFKVSKGPIPMVMLPEWPITPVVPR